MSISVDPLNAAPEDRRVHLRATNEYVTLTNLQWAMFKVLHAHKGEWCDRHRLARETWPDKTMPARAADNLIYKLLALLPNVIEKGSHGQGWRLP